MVPSVSYLGHVTDSTGLHPLPDKIEGVENAPIPRNLTELKLYLGLLTYYRKFIPNLAMHLALLYDLPGIWERCEMDVGVLAAVRYLSDIVTAVSPLRPSAYPQPKGKKSACMQASNQVPFVCQPSTLHIATSDVRTYGRPAGCM